MNKKIPALVAVLSLLAAAGGLSYGLVANKQKVAAQNEARLLRETHKTKKVAEKPAALVPLKTASAINTNSLAELQEQLAARDAELARLQEQLANRRNNTNGQPRPSFQERMAQLKEEDPERYAEMVQRRSEFQERMRYDQANRLATFVNLDTSGMTEEELANHTALVEKLSDLWEKTGEIDPENPPDRETLRQAFSSIREIGELMDTERSVMFRQLGAEVGLSGSDASDFASYVESIIETTTLRPPQGMRGQRGRNNGDAAPAGNAR